MSLRAALVNDAMAAAGGALPRLLPALSARASKRTVDALFLAHGAAASLFGLAAFLLPHVFEFFVLNHGEPLRFLRSGRETATGDQKVAHLAIRLLGALSLGLAYVALSARRIAEPLVRRALVQANAATFALMTLALARAVATEGGNFSPLPSAIVITIFASLSVGYGVFAVLQPIQVFEGLGKAVS